MHKRRIKLLFIISQFVQGGSERFLYEICKALDKDNFAIEILTKKRIDASDYYYPKVRALGIPVHRKLLRRRYLRRQFPFLFKVKVFRAVINHVHRVWTRFDLKRFFEQYDLINVIQIENYHAVQHLFADNSRLIIFLMSNRFQYDYDPYAECLPNRTYRFVLMDPAQREEIQGTNCSHAKTSCFPLAIDLADRERISANLSSRCPAKIGIFMRLSPERPIEPLFCAFRHLLDIQDALLHVYGGGNPEQFTSILKVLGIESRVTFKGHQPDLAETLKREKLSLVWMTSHGPILGYASIEVASFGLPVVFWNLSRVPYTQVLNETNGAIHTFSSAPQLAEYSAKLLSNPDELELLGEQLRSYISETYDIRRHIHKLQEYFREVLAETSATPTVEE